MVGCLSALTSISKLTWDNALLISPVLAKLLESQVPKSWTLAKNQPVLNESGQIAPDAAVFENGKQKGAYCNSECRQSPQRFRSCLCTAWSR